MKKNQSLWYKLLTAGKEELGWKYGLSVPFMVGAYSRKNNKDYATKEGLLEILNEMIETADDEELAVIKCTKYKQLAVYTIQVLSDIPQKDADNIRQNPILESKIFTTIEGSVSIESLADKLWDMYQVQILKGEFSAHRDETIKDEWWSEFDENEKKMIDNI